MKKWIIACTVLAALFSAQAQNLLINGDMSEDSFVVFSNAVQGNDVDDGWGGKGSVAMTNGVTKLSAGKNWGISQVVSVALPANSGKRLRLAMDFTPKTSGTLVYGCFAWATSGPFGQSNDKADRLFDTRTNAKLYKGAAPDAVRYDLLAGTTEKATFSENEAVGVAGETLHITHVIELNGVEDLSELSYIGVRILCNPAAEAFVDNVSLTVLKLPSVKLIGVKPSASVVPVP